MTWEQIRAEQQRYSEELETHYGQVSQGRSRLSRGQQNWVREEFERLERHREAGRALQEMLERGSQNRPDEGWLSDIIGPRYDSAGGNPSTAPVTANDKPGETGASQRTPAQSHDAALESVTVSLDAIRSNLDNASKGVARFGTSATTNYRKTFFAAHPELEGKVWVHHAVERQALKKYPGVVTEAEIHSLENLRGIPNAVNSEVHLSKIRKMWNEFYRTHPSATKQELLDYATHIDNTLGSSFTPPK